MLVFVDFRVNTTEMSLDELWEAWEEEANAALQRRHGTAAVSGAIRVRLL